MNILIAPNLILFVSFLFIFLIYFFYFIYIFKIIFTTTFISSIPYFLSSHYLFCALSFAHRPPTSSTIILNDFFGMDYSILCVDIFNFFFIGKLSRHPMPIFLLKTAPTLISLLLLMFELDKLITLLLILLIFLLFICNYVIGNKNNLFYLVHVHFLLLYAFFFVLVSLINNKTTSF